MLAFSLASLRPTGLRVLYRTHHATKLTTQPVSQRGGYFEWAMASLSVTTMWTFPTGIPSFAPKITAADIFPRTSLRPLSLALVRPIMLAKGKTTPELWWQKCDYVGRYDLGVQSLARCGHYLLFISRVLFLRLAAERPSTLSWRMRRAGPTARK